MKMKKITVRNFKSCDKTVELGKINFLIGNNGRGKSSFLNAINYLMTGNLVKDPIRHGQEGLSVGAVLDDGQDTCIERFHYLPDTYRINGEAVKPAVFKAGVEKNMQTGKPPVYYSGNSFFVHASGSEMYDFLLNGSVKKRMLRGVKNLECEMPDGSIYYMQKSIPSKVLLDGKRATGKALSALIADRMDGEVSTLNIVTSSKVMEQMSASDFAKYIVSIIPVTVTFDQIAGLANLTADEIEVISKYLPENPRPVTLQNVQEAYKKIFEKRAEQNRECELYAKQMQYNGQLPVMDKTLVRETLSKVMKALGSAEQIRAAWATYQKIESDRARILDAVERWKKELADLPDADPVTKEALDDLAARKAFVLEQIRFCSDQQARLTQANAPLRKMLENLDTTVCPLCDRLTCTTDKTGVTTHLQNAIHENEEACAKARENQESLTKNELKSLEDLEKEYYSRREILVKKDALKDKIDNAEKNLPSLPDVPPAVPDISGLQKKKEAYERYLQEATLLENCYKAKDLLEEALAKADLLTRCVKKTEPKKGNLTNALLEYILKPFCDHANDFLQQIYGDIRIDFRMDDEEGLSIFCQPHKRNDFISISAISTGEKMLVSFALMDMLSSISNARMIVFDNLESIDADTIKNLMDLLASPEIMDRYDHMFLSGVDNESLRSVIKANALKVNVLEF